MKLTELQRTTLALIAAGEVFERRYGYGAWRIVGAQPTVVGRLVRMMNLAEWGPIVGDQRQAKLTEAGRALLSQDADNG